MSHGVGTSVGKYSGSDCQLGAQEFCQEMAKKGKKPKKQRQRMIESAILSRNWQIETNFFSPETHMFLAFVHVNDCFQTVYGMQFRTICPNISAPNWQTLPFDL